MIPELRSSLDGLPSYAPNPVPAGAIKLDGNETVHAPLPGVLDAVALAAVGANRYPDNGATVLTDELARHVGVDVSRIAVGCGSVSLCRDLVAITCEAGDEVIFGWPSFEAYPLLTQAAGAIPVRIPLTANDSYDLPAMATAITARTRLIFVCNPNNPTGTVVTGDAIGEFVRSVPSHITIAVDEAYVEYRDDDVGAGALALQAEFPNVVVLRTFSKAYGLAGLRVGYAIGSPRVIEALRKVYTPFSVSAVAQRAAVACLRAHDALPGRIGEVVDERVRVAEALREMGFTVPDSQANFVWMSLGDEAVRFADDAARAGVLVRAFPGEGVRATVTTRVEGDALLGVARRFR